MRPLPIYVDLDDVLCETARGFLGLLASRFDRRVAFEEIHDFDLAVSFDLSPEELERFFDLAHRAERLEALAPIAGAIETVRGWVAGGHEVAVVTGRPPSSAQASRRWLARHRVPHRELVFVDKYGRPGGAAGVLPLDAVGPEVYRLAVEDSLATARTLAARGLPVLLLDRPWNRGACDGATRCADWRQVRDAAAALDVRPPAPVARSAGAISS